MFAELSRVNVYVCYFIYLFIKGVMSPIFSQRISVEKSKPLTRYSPVLLNWRGSFSK
jgi:hypothetical protein